MFPRHFASLFFLLLCVSIPLFSPPFSLLAEPLVDLDHPSESEAPKHIIAAVQHQDFNSYTQAYRGFMKMLGTLGLTERIKVEHFNAKKDMNLLQQKLISFRNRNDIDLVFTLGTQSTSHAVKLMDKKPIVFTVVGSPVRSGIIEKWESSERNITGIGTQNQVLKGITQIYDLLEFTSIGVVYLKGSPSHEAVYQQIKAMCKRNGLGFYYDGFPLKKQNGESLSDKEVQQHLRKALKNVLPKVDALYIQASGTYSKNFDIFRNALIDHQVPSFGDPIYIQKGIIIGVGVDNFSFGQQAASYAVKVLNGTPPSELPMDVGTKFSILANLEAAELVNFEPELLIPILNSADAIYQKIVR